jgi:hypothetical protein
MTKFSLVLNVVVGTIDAIAALFPPYNIFTVFFTLAAVYFFNKVREEL